MQADQVVAGFHHFSIPAIKTPAHRIPVGTPRKGPTKTSKMNKLTKILAPLCLLLGAAVINPVESQAAPARSVTDPAPTVAASYMAPEALAWCTKANAYGVRCAGPTQSTQVREPLKKALGYVGCSSPRGWKYWGDGMLYFCDRPLKAHEYDIRAKYGVTGA